MKTLKVVWKAVMIHVAKLRVIAYLEWIIAACHMTFNVLNDVSHQEPLQRRLASKPIAEQR